MPKSTSFTTPVSTFHTMFPGLTSLWMMPASWTLASASATPMATSRKVSRLSRRPRQAVASDTPPKSSMSSASQPSWLTSP